MQHYANKDLYRAIMWHISFGGISHRVKCVSLVEKGVVKLLSILMKMNESGSEKRRKKVPSCGSLC